MKKDKAPHVIPLAFPDGTISSLRCREGFKKGIDDFLHAVFDVTGVKFSRNEYILKCVRQETERLLSLPSVSKILEALEEKDFN